MVPRSLMERSAKCLPLVNKERALSAAKAARGQQSWLSFQTRRMHDELHSRAVFWCRVCRLSSSYLSVRDGGMMRNDKASRTERKFSAEQQNLKRAGVVMPVRNPYQSRLRDSDKDAPPKPDMDQLRAAGMLRDGSNARPAHQPSAAQVRARTGDYFRTDTRQRRKAAPVKWIFPA
jgi:hypothetical protein